MTTFIFRSFIRKSWKKRYEVVVAGSGREGNVVCSGKPGHCHVGYIDA